MTAPLELLYGTMPKTFRVFRTQQLKPEQDIDYKSCVDSGGKVVSHVFCLPQNYRKDVLPPTSKFSVDNCNQIYRVAGVSDFYIVLEVIRTNKITFGSFLFHKVCLA